MTNTKFISGDIQAGKPLHGRRAKRAQLIRDARSLGLDLLANSRACQNAAMILRDASDQRSMRRRGAK